MQSFKSFTRDVWPWNRVCSFDRMMCSFDQFLLSWLFLILAHSFRVKSDLEKNIFFFMIYKKSSYISLDPRKKIPSFTKIIIQKVDLSIFLFTCFITREKKDSKSTFLAVKISL